MPRAGEPATPRFRSEPGVGRITEEHRHVDGRYVVAELRAVMREDRPGRIDDEGAKANESGRRRDPPGIAAPRGPETLRDGQDTAESGERSSHAGRNSNQERKERQERQERRSSDRHRGPKGPRNSQTQPSPSPEPNQRRRGRPQLGAPVFRPASRPKAAKLPNSATPITRTQPEDHEDAPSSERRSSDRHRGRRPRNSQTQPRPSPGPNQGRRSASPRALRPPAAAIPLARRRVPGVPPPRRDALLRTFRTPGRYRASPSCGFRTRNSGTRRKAPAPRK